MGLPFQQLKRLWLLYIFLLFFAFFMFAISINVYVQSLQQSSTTGPGSIVDHPRRRNRHTTATNVIAHYIGKGDIFGNMTEDEYNINEFNPVEGQGAEGRPVMIPPRENFRMQRYFKLNSFNLLASDRIPLNRTLKDYRIKECQKKVYPNNLPTATVIIVFHNEAWSVLLRTVTSVINRSPKRFLREIILIDDASTRTYLGQPLDDYVKTLATPTFLLHTQQRGGLVPARLLGAAHAHGDVLIFLDAHCECSKGWLEPLLARIKEKRSTVICPVIDIISEDNFSYTKTFENHWGAFNWQMNFRWFATEREGPQKINGSIDPAKPIATPAMAGGLFAIDRKYFYEMGAYDKEMKIWGGENVEMSFRIWQCGGQIEISPCSHVGHIFRSSTPYTFPGGLSDVLGSNIARATKVWMDQWQYFIMMITEGMSFKSLDVDVTERLALRKRLQCKSFKWYLENIWPENFFPAADRLFAKIIWLDGESECSQEYSSIMRNLPGREISREWPKVFDIIHKHQENLIQHFEMDRDKCIRPTKAEPIRGVMNTITVSDCFAFYNTMDFFVITPQGQIKTNDNICITYSEPKTANVKLLKARNITTTNVFLTHCHLELRQLWNYDMSTQQIIHRATNLCLTVKSATSLKTGKPEKIIFAMECSFSDITQKWGLIELPWTK